MRKRIKWKSGMAAAMALLIGAASPQAVYAGAGDYRENVIIAKSDDISGNAKEKEKLCQTFQSALNHVIQWKKSELGFAKSEHMFDDEKSESFVSDGMDWYIFAMGRVGYEENYSFYTDAMEQHIKEKYESDNGLDARKATEWHRQILTLLAAGADPVHVGDEAGTTINLVADGTYNRSKTTDLGTQGVNGYIWALLSMDAMRYVIPQDAADTREEVLVEILKTQKEDGGFALGGTSDIDMTAMALQALAPYYNLGICLGLPDGSSYNIRSVVGRALEYLSGCQNEEGKMDGGYGCSSESLSQVITALCTLGIDPVQDERFVRNGRTLLDALLDYQLENGGFAHEPEGEANSIAGQQAACALAAYIRLLKGERSLYDMRPAMDETCREQIKSLEEKLEQMDVQNADEQTVRDCYAIYETIPAQERCYVYHYNTLLEAMEQTGLSGVPNETAQCMNLTQDGDGAVIQLYTPEPAQKNPEEKLDTATSPQRKTTIYIIIIAIVLCGGGLTVRLKKKSGDSWNE